MNKLFLIQRYWETSRHLKASQIVNRIYKYLKKPFVNTERYSQNTINTIYRVEFINNALRSGYQKKLYKGNNTYQFLNKKISTNGSWFPQGADQLWIYNLHYFEYLYEMSAEEGTSLLVNWIDSVPPGLKDAWHPYTVSLRISNWIWNYQKIVSTKAPTVQLIIQNSLKNQLRFLLDNIEFDVVGNHLIENCKAIIIGGLFFKDRKIVRRGMEILKKELKEQILSDGGHYEYSPMYHCIVLEDLIAVRDGLEQGTNDIPEWLQSAINKMVLFLYTIIDDNIFPFFNDSANGICLSPNAILDYVAMTSQNISLANPIILQESGLFKYKNEKLTVYFDFGKVCPDFLPAHAHNDMLSYTLKFSHTDVVTDSGVYEYTKGRWRDYFRSGFAHNCVVIDNRNPCDTWGAFRVGRRGYPYGFTFSEDTLEIQCGHSCYRDIGVEIVRSIKMFPHHPCIFISDLIVSKSTHEYSSRIHIAPDLVCGTVVSKDGVYTSEIVNRNNKFYIISFNKMENETSWYSREFGLKCKRDCITISGTTSNPNENVGYLISGISLKKSLTILNSINQEIEKL